MTLKINVRQIFWGWIVARKLKKGLYLAVGNPKGYTEELLLSYLWNLTVLMMMSNEFSGIFFQVICPGKYTVLWNVRVQSYQSAPFFIWMPWNRIFMENIQVLWDTLNYFQCHCNYEDLQLSYPKQYTTYEFCPWPKGGFTWVEGVMEIFSSSGPSCSNLNTISRLECQPKVFLGHHT